MTGNATNFEDHSINKSKPMREPSETTHKINYEAELQTFVFILDQGIHKSIMLCKNSGNLLWSGIGNRKAAIHHGSALKIMAYIF